MGHNRRISGAIQMMGDARGEEGVDQIINEVLDQRNKKIPKLEAQGEDMIRMRGDCDGARGRLSNQTMRFNFRKEAWGHTQIHERPN